MYLNAFGRDGCTAPVSPKPGPTTSSPHSASASSSPAVELQWAPLLAVAFTFLVAQIDIVDFA